MKKKSAKRWLIKNRKRIALYGASKQDQKQIKKCAEALGLAVEVDGKII